MKTPSSLLALSLAGAAQATSLSETTIDAAIRAGTLPIRRHGNRTLILTKDLERWLLALPTDRPPAPKQFEGRRTGRPRGLRKVGKIGPGEGK